MGSTGARGRTWIAPYLALLLVVAGVSVFALRAEGYQTHKAELNDGGIWVTDSALGYYGRLNKPIGQLDGALFARDGATLDIVQDGAAVVGVDVSGGRISTIDPATVAVPGGSTAQIPVGADVQMHGGTLAVLDPGSGKVWAMPVDPDVGDPLVAPLDSGGKPLVTVGANAAMTVTASGHVVLAAAGSRRLTTLTPDGTRFTRTIATLAARPGQGVALTSVGDRVVMLDPGSSTVAVLDGGRVDAHARTAGDAVLQQPGPDADAVLVADGNRLTQMDLSDGATTVLAHDLAGSPAAPVRLGACGYGAWGGATGLVVTRCGSGAARVGQLGAGTTTNLVFRVNRGQTVLNDATTGAVWNVDSQQPTRLDDWASFQKKVVRSKKNSQPQSQADGERSPPKAQPDRFGARPGRTTVLHPLDNDAAPGGRLLSISAVRDVRPAGAAVTVSPDGQTVEIAMPAKATTTTFEYDINDGREGVSAHATDTVTPRGSGQNGPPALRNGYKPHDWVVPAGGVLTIPVLPDWRDDADGDPLSLATATVKNGPAGASARPTSSGQIRFAAPAKGGQVTLGYDVTDGIAAPVAEQIDVRVQAPTDRQAHPARAEPDVVVGQVGDAITIHPLDNDLPGSDPIAPEAALKLAGKVTSSGGGTVDTDVSSGTVTFRSDQAKTYFLDYDAAFGNAPFSRGRVRVDVRADQHHPKPPVAMPDALTVYGQAAGLVDVLANDVDPAGGVLVVQGASTTTSGQLDVAVVNGRWLRVAASRPDISPDPQVVHYTISDGTLSGVQGDVIVTQRPAPADDTPVTQADRVTVRAGSGTQAAVLDNDFSPDGDPLHLVTDVSAAGASASAGSASSVAGALVVQGAGDRGGAVGEAFVSGKTVRYNAPAQVRETQTVTVRYVAANSAGQTAPGTLQVTVVPSRRADQPPEPTVLEGRVVAGDQVRLQLPGSGLDPDGDPVTLTGISSAPRLGRVLRAGADSLVYQAFPGSAGTDEFGYTVTDPGGATATGTVRVGVVPPTVPQAPVAVDDSVTVAPGRTATVDVLANDQVAAADRVTVSLVRPTPRGVSVDPSTGEMRIKAPAKADGREVQVAYAIGNGVASSQATVTLRTQAGYNNPPVVPDAYGTDAAGGAAPVSVDVLKNAYDPDGPTSALRVVSVEAPAGITDRISGGTIAIDRGSRPMVVPFVVADGDGGRATARLYVPPKNDRRPYVKADGLITVAPGATASEKLADHVVNPSGGPVSFTLKDRIWAAPEDGVSASITGDGTFTVHAASDYQGPGSVSFEVSTGAVTTILTVPVQVGRTKPVLRCPTDPIPVAQGQRIVLDVASICHVWTADPGQSLSYAADWKTSADGLAIVDPRGSRISVAASAGARPGTTAMLQVTAGGSDPGVLPVTVVAVPPPTLSPVSIADLKAGETRTIDLTPYLHAGVPVPQPQIVSVDQTTALDVKASIAGARLTLAAGPKVSGRAQFHVVMSDVAGDPPPNRTVEGTLSLSLLAAPDTPRAPVPGKDIRDGEVQLSWGAPAANGSPITSYEVRGNHGAPSVRCPSTVCTIGGLTNGTAYSFQVRAVNAVGPSAWSAASGPATPDVVPYPVTGITETAVGDGSISLRWSPPANKTSTVTYTVTYPGGHPITTSRPQATISGLNNDDTYTFTIVAANAVGWTSQPAQSAAYQSVGAPAAPKAPTVTTTPSANSSAVVKVSWDPVDANGPGPVRYRVIAVPAADGGPCTQDPAGITGTSCTFSKIPYDGTTYSFRIEALTPGAGNVPGGQPRTSTGTPTSWKAVGIPAGWGSWSIAPTGQNNQVKISGFNVPDSHGAQATVKIYRGSDVIDTFNGAPPEPVLEPTPDNDAAYPFHLEVCNESGACSQSSTKSVQSYGPLNDTALSINVSAKDDTVSGSWSADGNGRSATVRVTDSKTGFSRSWSVGAGTSSNSFGPVKVGFATTDTFTVQISDSGRGSRSSSASVTTPKPPPPTVAVSRGGRCNDNSANPCPKPGTGCIDPSCGYISLDVEGWNDGAAVTCSLTSAHHGGISTKTVTANGKTQTSAYFGYSGDTVSASCGGSGPGGNSASGSMTWP